MYDVRHSILKRNPEASRRVAEAIEAAKAENGQKAGGAAKVPAMVWAGENRQRDGGRERNVLIYDQDLSQLQNCEGVFKGRGL